MGSDFFVQNKGSDFFEVKDTEVNKGSDFFQDGESKMEGQTPTLQDKGQGLRGITKTGSRVETNKSKSLNQKVGPSFNPIISIVPNHSLEMFQPCPIKTR